MVIANSALRASLAIYHLLSNKREWNNCFIKFGAVVYLAVIAKFYWFLTLPSHIQRALME